MFQLMMKRQRQIIGKEGQKWEATCENVLLGVDIIIDDTLNTITISSFSDTTYAATN